LSAASTSGGISAMRAAPLRASSASCSISP
jgi:hypothetical protein